MLDKIIAALSIAALIGFMMIVLVWINELDLWVITVAVLVMASYDFYTSTRNTDKNTKK